VSGGFVAGGAQGITFVINLASAVALARLLSPEEFGLVAMVAAVTSYLGLLREAGLSTATVQTKTITQEQVSNLFWINVALGCMLGLLGMGLAPAVAWFYGDPRLAGIMVALAFTFFLTGPTVQHQALLSRQMRFRAIAGIDVTSLMVGVALGLGLALSGFGYWSLVGMQLGMASTTLALTWWVSGWRPTLPKRRTGVSALVKLGAHLTASDLIARLARNSDAILIGRVWGAGPLGLYSRAQALLVRPLEQMLWPVSSVLLPVLSRLQSDPQRYRQTFLRAFEAVALVALPMTALFFALSGPLIAVLLGPGWEGAAPLFAGFALAAVSMPLATAASWLFISQGRGRDLLHAYSVLSVLLVSAIAVGVAWGPLGVVLGLSVYYLLIRMPILYHLAGRQGPVRAGDLWAGFFSYLPCWAAVCVSTMLARAVVWESAPLFQLLVCGPVGLAGGAGAVLALRRPRETALYLLKAAAVALGPALASLGVYRSRSTGA
jgi:O-antigen/teichoic acid export membrane protein